MDDGTVGNHNGASSEALGACSLPLPSTVSFVKARTPSQDRQKIATKPITQAPFPTAANALMKRHSEEKL